MTLNRVLVPPFYWALGVWANWTFHWPHSACEPCQCIESSVGLHRFDSEAECVAAFANSPYETCAYANSGLEMSQCENAVSITEGYSNAHCSDLCAQVTADPNKAEKFDQECTFEFTIPFHNGGVAPTGSCFTNSVYGRSDYDPADANADPPLRVFFDVPTAAKCQELCQDTEQCALWTWRGTEDLDASPSRFQNPPLTCTIRSQDYVNNVLSVLIEDELSADRRYCDFEQVLECSADPFNRRSINPLHPHACLLCDCTTRCVFESPAHVSGPVYCTGQPLTDVELCHLHRPSWTTTDPPCPTEPPCPTMHQPESIGRSWFPLVPLGLWDGKGTDVGESTTVEAETMTIVELEGTTTGLTLDGDSVGLLERIGSWF